MYTPPRAPAPLEQRHTHRAPEKPDAENEYSKGVRSDLPPYDATLLGRRRASRLTFSAPRAAQGLHGAHDGAAAFRSPLAARVSTRLFYDEAHSVQPPDLVMRERCDRTIVVHRHEGLGARVV